MTSPASGSESVSQAFTALHPALQRWVYDRGWTSLHDAQERAIRPILDGRDVIISAATAAGKTEAAFLPICSALAAARDSATVPARDPWTAFDPWADPVETPLPGIEVLYVSPLKALINDQYDRLSAICERADIAVSRWHGDVTASAKAKTFKAPSGVLLITPESLEATFVSRGHEIGQFLGGLRYIVIDELHSFLDSPRGAQLASLLNRVELAIRRRPPRVGLSATLADLSQARRFLRPTGPDQVVEVVAAGTGEIRLQVRGYRESAPELSARQVAAAEAAGLEVTVEQVVEGHERAIAEHLYATLRGTDNLVFANSRRSVEIYADLLARRSADDGVLNEFWAHHGSLSKEVREVVEEHLKDRSLPVTAVCTSTLEMGIDIGSIQSIAQVGVPPSVASLRQRLGRSGRRDGSSQIRIYVHEPDLDIRSSPIDALRVDVVQTTAMVRLMLAGWLEDAPDPGFNYSTLIQQVLSLIAQHGGVTAADAYRALCGPGPFGRVDQARFARLLRAMAARGLITQAGDATLLHGELGERLVNHYSFYAAFSTPQEWRLIGDGRPLGTLPISVPFEPGAMLIFAGRRWRIVTVDTATKTIELTRAVGGIPPRFGGSGALVGDVVRAEMVAVYRGDDVPVWLDPQAQELLAEGRATWRHLELDRRSVVATGSGSMVFPWVGDKALATAAMILGSHSTPDLVADTGEDLADPATDTVSVALAGPALDVAKVAPAALIDLARQIASGPPPDPAVLARRVENHEIDKWDWVLDDDLAAEATEARLIDVAGAMVVIDAIAASDPPAAAQDQPQVQGGEGPGAVTPPS